MDRRTFIALPIGGWLLPGFADPPGKVAPGYGIAWTSIPVRTAQARQRDPQRRPPVPAEEFIALCHGHGAGVVQLGFDQLTSLDASYLRQLRQDLERRGMVLELGIGARLLESEASFAPVAKTAAALGVERLRLACLSGRRYETFSDLKTWQDFASHWKQVMRSAEPLLRRHRLRAGIENHKDWLAGELAAILASVSSLYLGACIDFGNNLALLEDSLEVARQLAPFAVTTHLKDMAFRPDATGFQLSEVRLGEGATPLREIIDLLRRARPDLPMVLEMITRDPLSVPYRTDRYWATYPARDTARIARFEQTVLRRAARDPLPLLSPLDPVAALAAEDDNLRRCSEYARQILKV